MTMQIVQTALELGLIYSLVTLSLFISYSILSICDLSTDGCYTLGCAVGAVVAISGHPILAIFAGMAAGVCSGFVTAILQTVFHVESILAGIIVNTGLYTVNLAVMGFSSNLSLFGSRTIFDMAEKTGGMAGGKTVRTLILLALIVLVVCILLHLFLGTRLGLSIRATGDSPAMVRASSINPSRMVIIGLCISNSLTGLAGALIGQYNLSCDINLGTGMVTVALASLVIGEMFFHKGSMPVRLLGAVVGSCAYRFVMSAALRLNIPTEAFKLVSALIVAIALMIPGIRQMISLHRKKILQMRETRERDLGGASDAGNKES